MTRGAERYEPLQIALGSDTGDDLPTELTQLSLPGWSPSWPDTTSRPDGAARGGGEALPFILLGTHEEMSRRGSGTASRRPGSALDEATGPSDNEVASSAPVVELPTAPPPRHRTELLEYLEGTVQSVANGEFTARFRDLLEIEKPGRTATLSFDEVPDADHPLVVPGAVFYWGIGYRVETHGQKSLQSSIRFRRLPVWTRREIAQAEQDAREFDEFFLAGD